MNSRRAFDSMEILRNIPANDEYAMPANYDQFQSNATIQA